MQPIVDLSEALAGGSASEASNSLLELVLEKAPSLLPDLVVRQFDDGTIVWRAGAQPFVLGAIAAAVWPFLDGRLTLGELAEDLADSTGVSVDDCRDYVASLGADLAINGLASGMDDVVDLWRVVSHADPPLEVTREEVVAGVRHIITEVEVPKSQIREMTGGVASPIELASPESCVGQRIGLDRPATIVSVRVGDLALAVRTADNNLAERLSASFSRGETRGPVVAFLTTDDHAGASRRLGLYDHEGRLVANTTDADEVWRAVLGALFEHVEVVPPDDAVEARGHVLRTGGRAVVAPLGALEKPAGMLRQLRRAGFELLPSNRYFLATDGQSVLVPDLSRGDPSVLVTGTLRRLPLAGVWARGNRPADEVSHAQRVAVLIRDSTAHDRQLRAALLDAADAALSATGSVVSYRTDRSASKLVGDLRSLVDRSTTD